MSNRRGARRFWYAGTSVVAIACAALLGLTACSGVDYGDEGDASDGAQNATTTEEAAPRESADSARNDHSGRDGRSNRGGTNTSTAQISLQNRAIERRGSVTIASPDVAKARNSVIDDALRLGGYVADEQSETDDAGDLDRVRLELVLPTDDFDEAMTTSADAGAIVSREQSARDVTEKVVDVNSRVDNATASLRRIRLLLGRAEKLGDVIRLESVLGQREADLESLQARQKSLQQRTTTASIEVSIRPTDKHEPVKDDTDDAGFLSGLDSGWSGLQSAWTAFATALGAILPFVVLLGAPIAAVALLVRRSLRRRTATT